jgi:hypothetical protein
VNAPSVVVLALSTDELRGLVRSEMDASLAAQAPMPSIAPLVDKRELARTLTVSPATITRLVQEGAPVTFVGQSPRFDIGAFRAWLDTRGRQGTKAKPSSDRVAGVRLLSRRGS